MIKTFDKTPNPQNQALLKPPVCKDGTCFARRQDQPRLLAGSTNRLSARVASLILSTALLCLFPTLAANSPAISTSPANPDTAPVPILLELFTSEGCSTCPPADDFLQRMDANQPVNGAQLIVLSEHVDYWNQDGWKDPYSSAQFTERQAGYVHALGIATPYTPQMIVDGYIELKGNSSAVQQTFEKEAKLPKISVRIAATEVDAASQLKVKVEAGGAEKHGGTVWIAVALDHAASQVSAGENSGKHLEHVAVVQELRKVGKLDKGKSFTQDVVLKLKPGVEPKNVRVIAFVQESNEGKVLGAASLKIANP